MSTTTSPRPVTPLDLLVEQLADLTERLASDPVVDPDLVTRADAALRLAAGQRPYLEACTTPESAALSDLVRATAAVDWRERGLEPEMLSGHLEGQLLKTLVHVTGATRVLEIGMFTGYAALAMAEALPPDGRVTALEVDPRAVEVARGCFAASPAGERVDVRLGPALDSLAALRAEGASYDLVFVDADKASYGAYLDAVLDGLLAERGLVCVDNTLMQGLPWGVGEPTANGHAIADFNRALAADPRVEQVLLPLRDGVTLVRRAPGRAS